MAKKNEKNTEPKGKAKSKELGNLESIPALGAKIDDGPNESKSQEAQSKARCDIVDPKRVFAELERRGLPTDGSEEERTNRLSSFFVHEAQKRKTGMIDCQPDDADDPLGCGIKSLEDCDVCPFCGKGGEIVAAPKEAPRADKGIESNVKAAEKKAEKKGDGVARVTSKDVKKKKEERGEKVEDKPPQPAIEASKSGEIVPSESEVEASDLPSLSASGTAADLDRMCSEIDVGLEKYARNQVAVMWEVGAKFATIRDRKLWSTVRHEDGGFAYQNFGSFVSQRFRDFDFTPDHAMLMIRIAGELTQEQAISLGIAKAKAILDAKNARNAEPITDAQKNDLILLAPDMSVSELRAKIKRMQAPQLPAASTGPVVATSADDSDDDEDRDDEDSDDEDDEDDEAPDSTRAPANKPTVRQPQMTSVTFEKKEFSIGLVQKGSQIKAAKKIQDEPRGTLSVPGGTKIHFVLKIGDDGQIFIEGKVETPY